MSLTVSLSSHNYDEDDNRYISYEVLHSAADLKKEDLFALDLSIYEAVNGESLPRHGQHWHDIRNEK